MKKLRGAVMDLWTDIFEYEFKTEFSTENDWTNLNPDVCVSEVFAVDDNGVFTCMGGDFFGYVGEFYKKQPGSRTSWTKLVVKGEGDSTPPGEAADKSVDNFLEKNVPSQYRSDVKNAFESDIKVTTLTEDTIVYRYYGGISAASSFWYTPNQTSNPIKDLALPPGNTAQFVDTTIIPKGTTLLEGTVAPNFGQTDNGGGYQYYVPKQK